MPYFYDHIHSLLRSLSLPDAKWQPLHAAWKPLKCNGRVSGARDKFKGLP